MDGGDSAGMLYCAPDTHSKPSRGKGGKKKESSTQGEGMKALKKGAVCLGSETTGAIGVKLHFWI